MSWWSSLSVVSTISTVAQWVVAIAGVIALVFSLRASKLQSLEDSAQRARIGSDVRFAQERATQLAERIAPRALTETQRDGLTAALTNARRSQGAAVPVVIATRMMDEESLGYGRQIAAAIEASGWTVGFTELSTHSFAGIAIFYNPRGSSSAACEAVQSAFRSAAIQFSADPLDVKRTPIQHEHAVYVIVGHKHAAA